MAAMVNHINQTQHDHIVTLENPIEFLHRDVKCSVTQREIGIDTDDFRTGLRAALRQDPDVVLIGEMRDAETIDTALKAAETGHLLVSTLHTPDAVTTISRIIAMFPPEEQEIVARCAWRRRSTRSSRSGCCRAPTARAASPALEMLLATGTIARHDPRRATARPSCAITSRNGREQYGMQTFDQHLMDLVADDIVTYETGDGRVVQPVGLRAADENVAAPLARRASAPARRGDAPVGVSGTTCRACCRQ